MINPSDILGMNARNRLYVSRNPQRAKSICHSKYATKVLLLNEGIPTADVYGILATIEDVNDFNWQHLEKNFVIKPTNGHAGKGVVAFKKKSGDVWIDVINRRWSEEELRIHCYDILEGQYSSHGANPKVIIEERVIAHPALTKYSYKGTPDIRVVVFNSVPVMAYMRLPTEESEGRANQSQGALGVGIDIGTGLTTYAAAHKTELIRYLPGTEIELRGIQIPFWDQVLLTAVKAANAADLVFAGVDLFIHKDKGPMVVELNYRPGLSIQIANQAGLRKRLERVEDLNVLNPKHGVRIAKALFAENYFETEEERLTIINPKEDIIIFGDNARSEKVLALIKTGRYRSALASDLARDLGLIDLEDLLWYQQEAGEGKVPVVEVEFELNEERVKTTMIVSKRLNRSRHKVELGRRDLAGFLVKVEKPS
jgi:alpha-L-glutamate ligase-like protein